jgi:hypothetical protein
MDRVSIVDGQLFHGNLTSLRPLLIYLRQDDVDTAIRAISMERGEKWVGYQVDWKLGSPYATRRGLVGLDGLIVLYHEYRALTDRLFAALDIPKISIETSRHEWAKYNDIIDRALRSPEAGRMQVAL